MNYIWLSNYQLELLNTIQMSDSVFEVIMALFAYVVILPLDLLCISFFTLFSGSENLQYSQHIDIKYILISFVFSGYFYRKFLMLNVKGVPFLKWLLFRVLSYTSSFMILMLSLSLLINSALKEGVQLATLENIALNSYSAAYALAGILLIMFILIMTNKSNYKSGLPKLRSSSNG